MSSEDGKQRSQRIQMDHFRVKGGLQRLRPVCIGGGLLLAGIYSTYVLMAVYSSAGGGSHVSTGPLATAHASFESNCDQCHATMTPIGSRGSQIDCSLFGVQSSESIQHTEQVCQNCHQVGDHHRDTMTADWQLDDKNCVVCHSDHHGREHDLTRVATTRCTTCHADLAKGLVGTTALGNVHGFDKESHGDFASLQNANQNAAAEPNAAETDQDPGIVLFDHHQHMLPGQVNGDENGAFTIGKLDEAWRERYRKNGQADSAKVTLACSDCHEMAGNPDQTSSLIADNELGRYLKPISFQQHCSACHWMNPQLATVDSTPLPHAVPWANIDLLLGATLSGARATGRSRTPRDDSQQTPQPGEGQGNPPPTASPAPALTVEIESARKMVQAQCLKCHTQESITDESIRASLADLSQPMIPGRWLKRGLYDHAAHRQIDCRYCHQAAYSAGGSAQPPTDQNVVMIDGIDSCTGCHRDAESPTPESISGEAVTKLLGGQPTWASDNCTLCHRYHTPLSGAAAVVDPSAAESEAK